MSSKIGDRLKNDLKSYLSSQRTLIMEVIRTNADVIKGYKEEKQQQEREIRLKDFQIYSYLKVLEGTEVYDQLLQDINCFLHHLNRVDMEVSREKNLETAKQIRERQEELDRRLHEAEHKRDQIKSGINKAHRKIKKNHGKIAEFMAIFKQIDNLTYVVEDKDLPERFEDYLIKEKEKLKDCAHKYKVLLPVFLTFID